MSGMSIPEFLLNHSLMPFEEVLRQSPLGMAIINQDGLYEAVNDAYCQLYGYAPEQLINQLFTIVFKPEMYAYVMERHRRFLKDGGKLGGEWEVLHKNGSILHVISESALVTGTDGQRRRLVYVTDITSRRHMEYDLILSRMFAHAMLDSLSAHVCVLDEQARIIFANKSWRRFFLNAQTNTDYRNCRYLDICRLCEPAPFAEPGMSQQIGAQLDAVLQGSQDSFENEYCFENASERCWYIVRAARIPGAAPSRIIVSHDNVSALKHTEEKLNNTLHFTRKLINSMQDGFMVLNTAGQIVDMNPALSNMTGYSEPELIHHYPPFFDTSQSSGMGLADVLSQSRNPFSGEFEVMLMPQNGYRFPANISISAVSGENGETVNYIVLIKNITERKRMEDDIRRMAFYDPLTNLPNRRLLHDRIDQALLACKRSGMHGALLMVDLDNFKPLNDKYGHDIGDQLLIEVSTRLRSCVREIDTVARMGGDEFVLVINDLHPQPKRAFSLISLLAEKIRSQLMQPYHLPMVYAGKRARIEHQCSASIGVAIFDATCQDGSRLLKLADQAMYQAKEAGRNKVQLMQFRADA